MSAAAPPRPPGAAEPVSAASGTSGEAGGAPVCAPERQRGAAPADSARAGVAPAGADDCAATGEGPLPGPDAPPADDAPAAGARMPEGGAPSAQVSPARRPSVIKQRRDFVRAANHGQRLGLPGLNLQARRRRAEEPAETPVRVGFTCSKKVGGAVQRNRAKRRLRAVAAEVLPATARPGWDYVLIGRREATAARPFPALLADLAEGVARLHAREDKADAARARGETPAPPADRPPRKSRGKGKR